MSKTSQTLAYLRVFFIVAAILRPRNPVRRRRQQLQRLEKHQFVTLRNMVKINMFWWGKNPYIYELRGQSGHLQLQRFVLLLEALQLLLSVSSSGPLEAQADSEVRSGPYTWRQLLLRWSVPSAPPAPASERRSPAPAPSLARTGSAAAAASATGRSRPAVAPVGEKRFQVRSDGKRSADATSLRRPSPFLGTGGGLRGRGAPPPGAARFPAAAAADPAPAAETPRPCSASCSGSAGRWSARPSPKHGSVFKGQID